MSLAMQPVFEQNHRYYAADSDAHSNKPLETALLAKSDLWRPSAQAGFGVDRPRSDPAIKVQSIAEDAPVCRPFRDVNSTGHGGNANERFLLKRSNTEELPSKTEEFQMNEKVKYYSETHQQWMNATVKGINRDENNNVTDYELDVKKQAMPSKIQSMPESESAELDVEKKCQQEDQEREVSDSDSSESTEASFKVGDLVEYWSNTWNTWMDATVNDISDSGDDGKLTYNLDVKRGAQADKIRKRANKSETHKPQTQDHATRAQSRSGSRIDQAGAQHENEGYKSGKQEAEDAPVSTYKPMPSSASPPLPQPSSSPSCRPLRYSAPPLKPPCSS